MPQPTKATLINLSMLPLGIHGDEQGVNSWKCDHIIVLKSMRCHCSDQPGKIDKIKQFVKYESELVIIVDIKTVDSENTVK